MQQSHACSTIEENPGTVKVIFSPERRIRNTVSAIVPVPGAIACCDLIARAVILVEKQYVLPPATVRGTFSALQVLLSETSVHDPPLVGVFFGYVAKKRGRESFEPMKGG